MVINNYYTSQRGIVLLITGSAFIGVAVSYKSLYLFHLLLGLFILYILSSQRIIFYKLLTGYHRFIYFFSAWYFLSVFWSSNKVHALKYNFYIVFGGIAFFTIVFFLSDKKLLRELFIMLAVLSFINIAAGVLESQTSFRLPVSPFSMILPFTGRPPLDLEGYTEVQVRYLLSMPTGFNWNPNNFAVFINMTFPFFLVSKRRAVKITGIVLCLYMIIKAGSRGNMVAFFLIFFLHTLLTSSGKINFISFLRTATLLLAAYFSIFHVLPAVLNMFGINSGKIYELISIREALRAYLHFNSVKTSSLGIRSSLILNGLHALYESCLIGVGAGNSLMVQQQLGMKTLSMHNFWVELLVEGGVFFFIPFVIWYLKLTL